MNSIERVSLTVRHELPDVVPVGPYMGNHGAKVAGVLIPDYCSNGRIMAEAQLHAWEIYQQDIVVAQSDNYYIAEGFGLVVEFPGDSTPVPKKLPISDITDISSLKVPDPYRDGRMPVYLEAINRLSKEIGKEVVIRGTGTGPFSLAGHLLGPERFLMELAMAELEPEGDGAKYLNELLMKTSEALSGFLRAELCAGAHIVQAGDSLASTDVISPAMYLKWAFPYEKLVFDSIEEALKTDHNHFSLLHICGNTTAVLDLMADTGANILELDYKVDLAHAKQKVGDKVCLMGNLNPTEVLLRGSKEIVEKETRRCLDSAAAQGGYILGSGCELAYYTPRENVTTMVQVAHGYTYSRQTKMPKENY